MPGRGPREHESFDMLIGCCFVVLETNSHNVEK